jgi:hypothetical protein
MRRHGSRSAFADTAGVARLLLAQFSGLRSAAERAKSPNVIRSVKSFRRRQIASVAVALALGCSAPKLARADEPVRITTYDPGEYPPPSTRWGLLAVGAGTSLVWYGGGLACSYLWPEAPGARDLRIPVAGPWMALADTGCADGDPDCSTFMVVTRAILTTMNGIGQAGGLAIVGEALFLPTAEAEAQAAARRAAARRTSSLRVRALPVLAPDGGVGLGVFGQF